MQQKPEQAQDQGPAHNRADPATGFHDKFHNLTFPRGFEIYRTCQSCSDLDTKSAALVAENGRWLHQPTGTKYESIAKANKALFGDADNIWKMWSYTDSGGRSKLLDCLRHHKQTEPDRIGNPDFIPQAERQPGDPELTRTPRPRKDGLYDKRNSTFFARDTLVHCTMAALRATNAGWIDANTGHRYASLSIAEGSLYGRYGRKWHVWTLIRPNGTRIPLRHFLPDFTSGAAKPSPRIDRVPTPTPYLDLAALLSIALRTLLVQADDHASAACYRIIDLIEQATSIRRNDNENARTDYINAVRRAFAHIPPTEALSVRIRACIEACAEHAEKPFGLVSPDSQT